MAQIIRLRRGTLAELNSVTLSNGEIGIVTGSAIIGDAALKTAAVIGHSDGTNRLTIARIIKGNATPNLSGVTGGAAFNDMLYHETDAKALKVLNTSGNTTLDLSANISVSEIAGNISGSLTSTGSFGYLNVVGDAVIGGNLTFGDANTDYVSFGADISSSIIPDSSNSFNLGSNSQRWDTLYLSGSISASGGPHHITSATTIDLDAEGALTLDGGSITIGGDTDVAVDIDSTTLDIDASGAITIDGSAISLGTDSDVAFDIDTSTLDIDSSGAITIDSTAGVSIDAGAASNLSTSAGALTVEGFTGINFKESGSNVIAIDTNRDVLFSQTGGSSGDPDVEIDGYLVVDGTAEFNGTVDIDGTVDVDNDTFSVDSSGAISLDAGATSNLTTSAGDIDINAAANLDLDGATVDIDSAGALSLQGAAASDLTTSAGAITVDGKTGVTLKEDGTAVIAIDTNRDVLFSQTGGSTGDPDVEIDGYSRFDGQVEVANTTTSTTTSTGALVVDGGAGIAENVNVGGNLTVTGNYTVNGTTTFISSSTLEIGDNIVQVNSVSPVRYGGIQVKDVNATQTGSLVWDSSNDYWVAGQSGSEYRVPIQNTVSNLTDNKVVLAQGNGRIESSANITDNGSTVDFNDVDLTSLDKLEGVDANTYVDIGGTGLIVTKGTLQPSANGGNDLGATGTRYANLWLSSNADVDGYLTVAGAITGSTHISASGNLYITGDSDLDGKLTVAGAITGSTHISASGNLYITGDSDLDGTLDVAGVSDFQSRVDAQASLQVTGSIYVSAGASVAATSASLVSFRNNSTTQLGYLASADTQAITTGMIAYNTSTGNLTVSSLIDGGSF